ncbi:DUF2572 family protein [Pasteurella canis]|uniref:DUF2572 family protein n=1 Tax=Pasteurella canis TaxID=753 RepID=UPI001D108B82|nr:DUF2572 family protein [Pasteurella canis]UDW84042.1 DUF2572 family protein [Pasteurella canis]
MKAQSGIVTLSILLLLSGILIMFLFVNEDLSRLYLIQTQQYKYYIKQSLNLQIDSSREKYNLCKNLPLNLNKNAHKLEFVSPSLEDEYAQYVWCSRLSLFKAVPHSALNEQKFDYFIQRENIPIFSAHFSSNHLNISQFYWFTAKQNEWELSGNKNAVVIAEGDLHIKGKGKITGTVITAGKLTLDPTIQVSYRKTTVEYWQTQLSHWRLVEKSWHDFKAL